MRIVVKAKTRAKCSQVQVKQTAEGREIFIVEVKEAPTEGQANDAIRRQLARYFNVPQTSVTLVMGHSHKEKVFDIDMT